VIIAQLKNNLFKFYGKKESKKGCKEDNKEKGFKKEARVVSLCTLKKTPLLSRGFFFAFFKAYFYGKIAFYGYKRLVWK
jgi:hypothetical protein